MSLCIACFSASFCIVYLMYVSMIFKEAEWPRNITSCLSERKDIWLILRTRRNIILLLVACITNQ